MIGVFDSGVGGLCALRAARAALPDCDFVYFADTRNLPYGERSACEILLLARRAVDLLSRMGADAILAACGTVSTVALPTLRREFPIPLFGVVRPAARAAARAAAQNGGDLALLGTAATIRTGVFAREIHAFRPHAPIHSLPCPLFVHLAERGATTPADPMARLTANRILAPLAGLPVRTVVLGCTHFSCLAPLLSDFFPHAVLVDAAAEGAEAMAAALPQAVRRGRGTCRFLTSGDAAAFAAAATPILGEEIAPEHISAI